MLNILLGMSDVTRILSQIEQGDPQGGGEVAAAGKQVCLRLK